MAQKNPTQNLKELLLNQIHEGEVRKACLKLIKGIEKELVGAEFKLKRTIQDKQIATTILESTINELEVKTETLNKQKTLIEEQAKFKEEMFANVSHELRTPLHGILGMSHLLTNTSLNGIQKEYVEVIKGSADNLLVIINDILSLSQINAGKIKILSDPFSVHKFFNDLESILEVKASKKDLNLIFMKPPNLPSYLLGDRTRLYQILLNLLNNAIKFTHKGYVALNIYILEQTEEQIKLRFEIKDSGIGIKKEKLASVFESFTQVHETNGVVYEGAGLGLNIVRNLLSLMNGNIDVSSEEGKGTCFVVELSFDIPGKQTIEAHESLQTDLIIPPHWQYKKILMIEDNHANILYAKNMFDDWNIKLEIAETIKEAKEIIENKSFDCILSDVKLPDGNGMEFITNLRKDETALNQKVPVMVLTASANEKEENYSKEIDVQSYIGKPFRPELLVSELKKVLDQPVEIKVEKKATASTPTKTNAKEVISEPEIAYFQQLEKNFKGKTKLKLEMINVFLSQISKALTNMEQALEEDNISNFHFEAHRIKSTINIIGLPKLQPVISKLDEYCYKQVNLDQIPDLFKIFRDQSKIDVQKLLKEKERLSALN